MRTRRARKGFTLVELMVAMAIGSILLLGMGSVLVMLFTGMRESRNFATATGRVDLIRQLSFDARTGNQILYPTANGPGTYVDGTDSGHQIRFNTLLFDPVAETTSSAIVTWESRRPTAATSDPFVVRRYINTGSGDVFTFGQDSIVNFTVTRSSARSFSVETETEEAGESIQVQLAVTLRNVVE